VVDPLGLPQLFHSNPDGSERILVTQLPASVERIELVQWSFDGMWLAFATVSADGTAGLWSAPADGSRLVQAAIAGFVPSSGNWWSQDGATFAVLAGQWQDAHPVSESEMVLWIDSRKCS
jgi:hypothetical protein